jgi:hypothetical protein
MDQLHMENTKWSANMMIPDVWTKGGEKGMAGGTKETSAEPKLSAIQMRFTSIG